MRRSLEVWSLLALFAGCSLPGIELGGHPLKPEGVCASRGGTCSCDGNVKAGQPSPYPALDCPYNMGCPVVCYGADPLDAGVPDAGPWDPRVPRLMVGNPDGVLAIWNKVTTVTSDVAPSESVAIPMGLTSVAAEPGVFVAGYQNGDVAVFDAPRSFDVTTVPRATVHVGDAGVVRLLPAAGDLWILMEAGDNGRLVGFAGATAASTVEPIRAGAVLDAVVAYPKMGVLFASAASSGQMQLCDTHLTPPMFMPQSATLSQNTVHQLAMAGQTIYFADDQSGELGLFGAALTSVLNAPGNRDTLPTGLNSVARLVVQRDVAIVAGKGSIALYLDAALVFSRVTKPKAPDKVITHASLGIPIDVALGADGRLYVLDADGISIFKDVKSKPTFVTKVTSGITHPRTLTLIE